MNAVGQTWDTDERDDMSQKCASRRAGRCRISAEITACFSLGDPVALTVALTQKREGTMELLELDSPSYGVSTSGIYIIDDDGEHVCAGPFDSEIAAIAWVDLRQQNFVQRRWSQDSGMY